MTVGLLLAILTHDRKRGIFCFFIVWSVLFIICFLVLYAVIFCKNLTKNVVLWNFVPTFAHKY